MNDGFADGREAGSRGSRAERVFDLIVDGGAILAAVLMVAVMLTTTVKVVFRYGLHEGLIGIDQISGTMLLYITFLGAAWVLRREEHVTLDLLVGRIGPEVRRQFLIWGSIAGMAVCFAVTGFGAFETVSSWQRGIRIPAELEMPRAINLVVIPIGCLFLGLQFARRAWRHWRRMASAPPAGIG
ncbi:MAG: TRAP transporter small permease [Defluviicoccus sp.]|nr:TRAP transporter small permease [Defluviicoccus sp.]MDE0274943.1 TRAP transporter small permease [Defluviicoccus sp.]